MLTIWVDPESEAEAWPEATEAERLNSTAMTLLVDNLASPRDDMYYIHFSILPAYRQIIFRTAKSPELLTRFRHVLSELPELRIVSATI